MALGEKLPIDPTFHEALALATLVAAIGTFVMMPIIIRKLRGAGILGQDVNKVGRESVPEMGGIGAFLGLNVGVFVFLLLYPLSPADHVLLLAALVASAGAALTGVIDDLVELRQRVKAVVPLAFAAPVAVFVSDYTVAFPVVGAVDFGLLYPLLLVPVGIVCASNGFNMLEGYNGLGAGLGIVMAAALAVITFLNGSTIALVLLLPLIGTLLAFLHYNRYPAKVFPGDTLTLFTGTVLAAAAILGKAEFWGALLFIPHIAEFFLKARGQFKAESFATGLLSNPHDPPRLLYEGRTESLTHVLLKLRRMTEPRLVLTLWTAQALLAAAVVAAYYVTAF